MRPLRKQLIEFKVRKEYLALILGDPPHDGEIDFPLAYLVLVKQYFDKSLQTGDNIRGH